MQTTTSAFGSCKYCGGHHGRACPMVRAIEYYRDGSVKRVELGPVPIVTLPWYPTNPDIPYGPSLWDVHNPIKITD